MSIEKESNKGKGHANIQQDFNNSLNIRLKIEERMSFDDYLQFVNQINYFAGHPQKAFRPITGERFLL